MKKYLYILLAIIIFLLPFDFLFAQGRTPPLIVKGKYFSIYGDKNVDIEFLLKKINFNYLLHLETFSDEEDDDIKSALARTMDALYLEVSDIMGINIYSYHGNIELLADKQKVNEVFREYFDTDFPERSLYLHNKNTIYISLPDITLGMLGHEIAHAIMSHYFIVPPPAKVQEVLAGYVEYNLRKSTGTLP